MALDNTKQMWPPAGHVDQWEDPACSATERVPRHFRSRRYIPAPLFTMVSRRRKQFELIIVESDYRQVLATGDYGSTAGTGLDL
jgi:hypothetical protein